METRMGNGPFSQIKTNRKRGNGLKLCHGRIRLGVMEDSFPERIVEPFNSINL